MIYCHDQPKKVHSHLKRVVLNLSFLNNHFSQDGKYRLISWYSLEREKPNKEKNVLKYSFCFNQ